MCEAIFCWNERENVPNPQNLISHGSQHEREREGMLRKTRYCVLEEKTQKDTEPLGGGKTLRRNWNKLS